MDSTVPREKLIISPSFSSAQTFGEILFEKEKYRKISSSGVSEEESLGVISFSEVDFDEEHRVEIFNTYVEKCGKILSERAENADIIFVCGSGSFLQTRCAVLAAKENLKDAKIYALVQMNDDKNTADGWGVFPCFLTLQAMGCSGILLSCTSDEALKEAVRELEPYAKIPIAVWTDDIERYAEENVHVLLKNPEDSEKIKERGERVGFFTKNPSPPLAESSMTAVSNGEAWSIDSNIDISEAVVCDEDFHENLLSAEEESFVIKVEIDGPDGLDVFETEQYMLKNPVCISSESEEIFEKAVRMFCGIAVYDGTCDISEELLASLSAKYGLIIL